MRKERGITLIALVVTIVVLLILAAVSISMLGGENGIITQAQNAKEETRAANIEEERDLWKTEVTMSKTTGETVKSMEEKLNELKDKDLLSQEEVNSILADENNAIQIGSKYISFKVDTVVEPENIDDWEWITEDGYVTITGYKGADTIVTVPNSINGIPVKKLCSNNNYKSIWKESICSGEYIYYNCHNVLTQKTITKVIISEGIEEIGEGAFLATLNLSEIVIPDSIINISDKAFVWCTSLTNIKLPDTVNTIGDDAFDGCTSLTNIEIPSSVTSIGRYAFFRCTALTSIKIPNNVTTIGWNTFGECSSLMSIVIPSSVTSIKWGAFINCTSLTTVNYTGTKEQWQQISIDSSNTDLTNAQIICTNGTI